MFEEHRALPCLPVKTRRNEYLPGGTTVESFECGTAESSVRDHKRLVMSEETFFELPDFNCKGTVAERGSVVPLSQSQRARYPNSLF
jgi:hypothetical protein